MSAGRPSDNEIRRVREMECRQSGHVFEVVEEYGKNEPIAGSSVNGAGEAGRLRPTRPTTRANRSKVPW